MNIITNKTYIVLRRILLDNLVRLANVKVFKKYPNQILSRLQSDNCPQLTILTRGLPHNIKNIQITNTFNNTFNYQVTILFKSSATMTS